MSLETLHSTSDKPDETAPAPLLVEYADVATTISHIDIEDGTTQDESAEEARREIHTLLGDATDNEVQASTMLDMDDVATWDMATAREHLGTKYDHFVEVDGKIMNVNVQGEGDEYVVLLPGRGVTAPSCDFAPLIAQLKDTHKVVTIEPFGSGLSDMTDVPRTSEQLTTEFHRVLQKIDAHNYTLVPHSISGLYALHYANKYPDEVNAVVGIDTATPNMRKYTPDALIEATTVPDDAPPESVEDDIQDVEGYVYSPEEMTRMRALKTLNDKNDGIFEDIKERSGVKGGKKPYDSMKFLPTMTTKFFLSTESVGFAPKWYEDEHVKQLTPREGSEVRVLPGGHFLHHNQAAAIAAAIKSIA